MLPQTLLEQSLDDADRGDGSTLGCPGSILVESTGMEFTTSNAHVARANSAGATGDALSGCRDSSRRVWGSTKLFRQLPRVRVGGRGRRTMWGEVGYLRGST